MKRSLIILSLLIVANHIFALNLAIIKDLCRNTCFMPDSTEQIFDIDTIGSGHFVEGYIVDMLTGTYIEGDTDLNLMTTDSLLITNELILLEIQEDHRLHFLVEIPKPGDYIINITNPFYHPMYKKTSVKFYKHERVTDIGGISMKRKNMSETDHVLDEVVVKGTKLKFYFDNDTLVYNADAFLTQKGFVLYDILKKMPGIVLNENGQIYANGKEVDVLLLDGKEFFNRDRKTIINNLPAFMVKNVKVYGVQKDNSGITEYDNKPQGHIMDITLKPDYHSSALGNIGVGVGTDRRYDAKAFGLKFNDLGRLSLYANGNNVNKEETVDSEGNTLFNSSNEVDEKIRDNISMRYNASNRARTFKAEGDVEYRYEDTYTYEAIIDHVLADSAGMNSRTLINENDYKNVLNTRHVLNFFADSPHRFVLVPSIQFSRSKTNQNFVGSSFSKDVTTMLGNNWKDSIMSNSICKTVADYGLNRSVVNAITKQNNINIGLNLYKSYVIPHTNNTLSLQTGVNFRNNETSNMSMSYINYLQEIAQKKEIKDYYNNKGEVSFQNYVSTEFDWKLGGFTSMSIGYSFKYYKQDIDNNYYLLHNLKRETADYTLENIPSFDVLNSVKDVNNSYSNVTQNNHHCIQWHYNYRKDGTGFSINVPFRMEYNKLAYTQADKDTLVRKKLIMPDVSIEYNQEWKKGEDKFIFYRLSYRLSNQIPDLLDLVDRTDDVNPLYIRQGNSKLKNPRTHTLTGNFSFRKQIDNHEFDWYYRYEKNNIVKSRLIDDKTGGIIYTPQNASGNRMFGFSLSNKVYFPRNIFNIFNNFSFSHDVLKDYIDTNKDKIQEEKTLRDNNICDNLGVGFMSPNTKYIISFSGYITYTRMKNVIEEMNNSDFYDYGIKLNAALECPWDIRIKTDFKTINRQGYDMEEGKITELIWNASLSKSFSENATLSIECFDILNQRKLINNSVMGLRRMEIFNNGIRRYGMLRFVYRLNSSKKHSNNEHHNHSH